ncbi:MAG: serine/threonine-protein kinase [Marinicella sp.]|nr:serine/threonine protein kinase [Xanthomonadales bacterium]
MNNKQQIDELLKKVLIMETQEAFDYLESVKADDEVINQVALLLKPSKTRTVFLQERGLMDAIIRPKQRVDLSGTTIKNFKLLKPLGEGGMGAVYLGEDTTLQRQVAIKALHNSHQISPKIQDRFRREALILSQLDHPNICRIYNLIETEQSDYLVLELIKGKTLKQTHLQQLSRARKFDIALALLEALKTAHSKNIIHRDLKPENIMINDKGEVKVLDFGISRLGESARTDQTAGEHHPEKTSQTVQGTVMGTLTYMSPEQAAGEDLTTASDIYTMGLVFQEIFSKTAVYADHLTAEQLLKLSTAANTQVPTDLSQDLTQLIQRMKSKVPAERPTAIDAIELLEKIRNKPARRLKYGLVAVLLLIASLSVYKHINDLNRERQLAQIAREQAEQVTEFLTSIFKVSNPYLQQAEDITAINLLEQGAQRIDTELKEQPQLQAFLKATIGDVYHVMGLLDQAESLLKKAYNSIQTVPDVNQQIHASIASMYGTLRMDQGAYEEAEALFQEAIAVIGNKAAAETLANKNNLALIYNRLNQFEKTIKTTDEIITIYKQHPEYDLNILLNALNTSGMAKQVSGNLTGAENSFQKALDIIKANPTAEIDFSNESNLMGNLAGVYSATGRSVESLELRKKVVEVSEQLLPENHPDLIGAYDNLAVDYYFLDDLEQAKFWNKKSLEVFENLASENQHQDDNFNYSYSMTLANYGVLLTRSNDYQQAEFVFSQVIENMSGILGAEHKTVADYVQELANVKLNLGLDDEAFILAEQAIEVFANDGIPFSSRELKAWIIKATVLNRRGLYDEVNAIEVKMKAELAAMEPVSEKLLNFANEKFNALKQSRKPE